MRPPLPRAPGTGTGHRSVRVHSVGLCCSLATASSSARGAAPWRTVQIPEAGDHVVVDKKTGEERFGVRSDLGVEPAHPAAEFWAGIPYSLFLINDQLLFSGRAPEEGCWRRSPYP